MRRFAAAGVRVYLRRGPLELQAALAGALGERPDAPVVAVARAVEDAALHPGLLPPLGEQLPGALRLLHRVGLAQLLLGPVDRRQGVTRVIVDELGEDPTVRAVDRESRPLGAATHLGAN